MAAIAAGIVVYVVRCCAPTRGPASLDQAVASAHAMPMVGVVLDDVPGSQRLREALKEEMHRPTTEGVSRPLKLMRELRADYVVPALARRRRDDRRRRHQGALGAAQAPAGTDLPICKEFALTGIQQTERLDAVGQKLLREVLAALERAYRSGRAVKSADSGPPGVASAPRRTRCSPKPASAGVRHARPPVAGVGAGCLHHCAEVQRCAVEGAADKRGPLMRYLLTVQ